MWKGAYRAEFVAYATSRGWPPEDAAKWARGIVDEALTDHGGDPAKAARIDVLRCEYEERKSEEC